MFSIEGVDREASVFISAMLCMEDVDRQALVVISASGSDGGGTVGLKQRQESDKNRCRRIASWIVTKAHDGKFSDGLKAVGRYLAS